MAEPLSPSVAPTRALPIDGSSPYPPEEIQNGDPILARLVTLGGQLDKRVSRVRRLNPYYEGTAPAPDAVIRAGVTRAYRTLMPLADAPWGSLIVDSVQDRLEIAGIVDFEDDAGETEPDGEVEPGTSQGSGNSDAAKEIWETLQVNHIDAESKLAHNALLTDGRAFATVWPNKDDGENPKVTFDGPDMMIVQYAEGSRYDRRAALRRWVDEDSGLPFATLYTPDFIYKFEGPKNSSGQAGTQWQRRIVSGEDWPLRNVLGVVPVVELAVNRRLKPGSFGWARGEFEHCVGLLDRINMLTFLGLVVAFWMGFPLRAVIGEKILRDDKDQPLPPFQATADSMIQLENPEVKFQEFKAADRNNLSIFAELSQLAMITKTPRHYFPYAGGLSNISADAIRADEGALNAKVVDHKSGLGEGWLEVARLVGLAKDTSVKLSPKAKIEWKNHESRSLIEAADAAAKFEGILPWQIVAEKCLNATAEDIERWAKLRQEDAMAQLAEAVLANNRVGAAVAAAAEGDVVQPNVRTDQPMIPPQDAAGQ